MHRRNSPAIKPTLRGLCTAAESVGDVVCISGAPSGGIYPVRKANCWDNTRMPAVGVIILKTSLVDCYVQRGDVIRGVWSGLVPGKFYRAGRDGEATVEPVVAGPTGYAIVQFIGQALSDDEFAINMQAITGLKRPA